MLTYKQVKLRIQKQNKGNQGDSKVKYLNNLKQEKSF